MFCNIYIFLINSQLYQQFGPFINTKSIICLYFNSFNLIFLILQESISIKTWFVIKVRSFRILSKLWINMSIKLETMRYIANTLNGSAIYLVYATFIIYEWVNMYFESNLKQLLICIYKDIKNILINISLLCTTKWWLLVGYQIDPRIYNIKKI